MGEKNTEMSRIILIFVLAWLIKKMEIVPFIEQLSFFSERSWKYPQHCICQLKTTI